jgi:hypothetical protein
MATSKIVKRICGNCGHQWMATPPMKAPNKIGLEADLTYQRRSKADILKADYVAKLNASHASRASFETCTKCGSTGGIRTEYSPAQAAAIDLQQRMNRRLLLAALTLGMSEAFRFIVFSTKLIKRTFGWFRDRRASVTEDSV